MSCIGTLDALDEDVLVCPLTKENMNELKNHPLLITLRDAISGDGFLAGITLSGRALMRKEDDGKWWMYGVRPAALAESGTTIEEAFLRFRGRYREVLFDIAQENSSFDDFRKEVERFFYEPGADGEDERLWEDALTAIRTGGVRAPDEFSGLERKSPETTPSQITVELLNDVKKRFMPSDNVRDTYAIPDTLAA